jgi:hypothetical protein
MDKEIEMETDTDTDGSKKEPDYFEFEFSLKRHDYKKYLVGISTENFLAFCGCDDKANVADASTINKTAHAYRRYIFHLCRELNMNTDEIVKKFKKLERFSFELEDIIKQKCLKLRAEINRKYHRNGKTIMKSGQKIAMFIFAWEKFCRANGIKMYWDDIRGIIPKKQMRKAALDEAYTHEQIKLMIPHVTDLRIKVAIHFMASGGLRREAMTTLLDKHVSPVEINGKLVCAKVITYNEEEGTYITFVTPEAYNLYLLYKKERKRYGEVFDGSGNNPVIIEKFDVWNLTALKDKLPKQISPPSLDRLVSAILVASGVRERSDFYTHRYKVKCLHGFRSFFYETLKKVRKSDDRTPAIPLELCHALLGDRGEINQRAPQDASYDKKTDKEFNEIELRDAYLLAVPYLTISEEARERALKEKAQDELKDTQTLKIELEKVKQDKSQESQEFQELKQEVQQLREVMATISSSGVTVPMIKNDKIVPSIPQKVVHMGADALFKNAEIKLTKPKHELVPAISVEESLISELADLKYALKDARKNRNKKLVNELESKIEVINNRLNEIAETIVEDMQL